MVAVIRVIAHSEAAVELFFVVEVVSECEREWFDVWAFTSVMHGL